jgi:hypothetical protein
MTVDNMTVDEMACCQFNVYLYRSECEKQQIFDLKTKFCFSV